MIRCLSAGILVLAFARITHALEPTANCTVPSSSFEVIRRGIFERRDCTQSFCHGADRQAGLDLRAGNAYASLLRPAGQADQAPDQSSDLKLVEPGRPEESLLWLALAVKALRLRGVSVTAMPLDGLPLSRDEIEGVRLWILAGAPETSVVNRVADLIDVCPPPSEEEEDVADLPTCQANDPSLLLPNLVADPPDNVRILVRNGHRRVEFTTRVGNTGDGPLIIQAGTPPAGPGHSVDAVQVILQEDGSKCVRRAGTMRFSEDSVHWSYGNWCDFELRKDDPLTGEVVASSSKPAFCLVDSDAIRSAEDLPHQYELHCTDPIGRMGISVGYKDTYSRIIPTQWIDLDADPSTPVERGTYFLVNIADPSSHLWEQDDKRDDNANYTRVSVSLADPDPPTPQPTPPPQRTVSAVPAHRTVAPVRTVRTPRPPHVQRTPGAGHPAHPAHPAHPVRPAPTRRPTPLRSNR